MFTLRYVDPFADPETTEAVTVGDYSTETEAREAASDLFKVNETVRYAKVLGYMGIIPPDGGIIVL